MGYYMDTKKQISEETFIDIFKRISNVLNELHVKYWISFGTLLGYVRDGKHIAGDSDLDFGITSEGYDILEKNKELIYKQGFSILESNEIKGRSFFHSWRGMFIYDNKIKNFHIDISEWKYDYEIDRYTFRWYLRLNLPSKIFNVLYKMVSRPARKLNDEKNIQQSDFGRYKQNKLLNLIARSCFVIDFFFNTKRELQVKMPYIMPDMYYGVKTYIPSYPYAYCKLNYGENFMIPNGNYRGKGGCEYIREKKDNVERCYIDE